MTRHKNITIGELFHIFTGRKNVNDTDEDGKYTFFSCAPETFRSNDFLYDGEAIIITGNGSYTGTVRYFNGKFDLYQRTYALTKKGNANVDTKYVFYVLKRLFEPKYLGGTRGSSIPYIVLGDIANFELTLPPLSEQKRIANILSSFDNKIEILKKENKILEDIAENIFKEWFVKYNFPNKDGKPYRDNNGKMIDSELGPIPEGWRVGNIYEICNILYGYPFNSKLFSSETGFPLIRIRNLADSSINTFTTEDYDEKYIIQAGDILVGMDGDFIITRWNSGNALLNQRICKLEPQSNVSKSYILYITKPYIGLLQKTNFGTTVAHLGKSDWDRFRVLIPNKDIFVKYNKFSNTLEKKLINNHKNIQNLIKQKKLLIKELITT